MTQLLSKLVILLKYLAIEMIRESLRKNVMEPYSNPCHKNRATHEERRLQIDELDEWRTHVKEKPKAHNESKRHHDEYRDETTQFKVGDKVLLDKKDPQFDTLEHDTDESTPFTIMNIFPHGTVEVTHTKFRTFKVNNTQLRPYFGKTDRRSEELQLLNPP
ncbi:hypothetical protein GOBAR_AA26867 [Gossypium barbadense]|uniref:Uncharacterized protein n=1 Tax=Gossypium barbadense TaxID=3634 RepID=A0A2P5WRS8_GOSBA|nr:hypothetical protein GOBAR_AA26867 [Gossypium barbadense]